MRSVERTRTGKRQSKTVSSTGDAEIDLPNPPSMLARTGEFISSFLKRASRMPAGGVGISVSSFFKI
jgi:hypothetical protein